MEIKSAFHDGGIIPERYTCEGDGVSPPVEFFGVPGKSKSLALIVDDPDSPSGNFVHWVLFNIPAAVKKIKENSVPRGAVNGRNDFEETGYGGPCPQLGKHKYCFKLFALNTLLKLPSGSTREEVENAMKGHILAQAVLTGFYSR